LKEADLIRCYPRLWHVAEDGSWDSIRRHGLLSTTALLDLFDVHGERRYRLESERRPESVPISVAGLSDAVLRDQKPTMLRKLEKSLVDGTTLEHWFAMLNGRVFFWLSLERLRTFLFAYRSRPQTVLTVDTASLLKVHGERVHLSPINSGATLYNPPARGRHTFLPVTEFPFEERLKRRLKLSNAVVELTVLYGVPDIAEHTIEVHAVGDNRQESIWQRQSSGLRSFSQIS
jgi:hypothetical protein